ncbi:hypothetical protein CTI92_03275 [Staphylococcus epidermidis]|uniref:transcriptional regulator, SarA/Rot family n=1 Tax=Staphylococcus epidermidis TaxID=1282 RepID=UPI000C188245|nr:hypothetical protein [Staphylococcus epidermidis]PIH32407.1 hypothetical protein CTI92_03275 [Staphylococcus epidermidis]
MFLSLKTLYRKRTVIWPFYFYTIIRTLSLTLLEKGSMTLKEMDKYVHIKPYKRTRTYNNLVNLEWIYKERPQDDERTVIIHFNDKQNSKKEDLLKFIDDSIKIKSEPMQSSLQSILAVEFNVL